MDLSHVAPAFFRSNGITV